MADEATFAVNVDASLRDAFLVAAEQAHLLPADLVRAFMQDFIARQRDAGAHDAWMRAEIAQGLREADDPGVRRIPHQEIAAAWRRQRAELERQVAEGTD